VIPFSDLIKEKTEIVFPNVFESMIGVIPKVDLFSVSKITSLVVTPLLEHFSFYCLFFFTLEWKAGQFFRKTDGYR
jgi:hypothetical protein